MNRDQKLVICMEECAELSQVCSKVIRFGMTTQRRKDLVEEIGDVLALVDLVIEELGVCRDQLEARRSYKKSKLLKEAGVPQ